MNRENREQKYLGKVLHILNGSCMLEAFKQNGKMEEGCTYVPFNEAMCWGTADEQIFSEPFIEKRVQSLKSTKEMYKEIVLEPLKPLFEESFDQIVMWFGDDLFCQINMLTMMAYLEQINYNGDLQLCIGTEDEEEFLPECYKVTVEGALEAYRVLVCHQQMPQQELLPITAQMAKLYLEYRLATSEINQYIMNHPNKEKELLVEELLGRFPQYGLGDLQYEMMIDDMRGNKTWDQ